MSVVDLLTFVGRQLLGRASVGSYRNSVWIGRLLVGRESVSVGRMWIGSLGRAAVGLTSVSG